MLAGAILRLGLAAGDGFAPLGATAWLVIARSGNQDARAEDPGRRLQNERNQLGGPTAFAESERAPSFSPARAVTPWFGSEAPTSPADARAVRHAADHDPRTVP